MDLLKHAGSLRTLPGIAGVGAPTSASKEEHNNLKTKPAIAAEMHKLSIYDVGNKLVDHLKAS